MDIYGKRGIELAIIIDLFLERKIKGPCECRNLLFISLRAIMLYIMQLRIRVFWFFVAYVVFSVLTFRTTTTNAATITNTNNIAKPGCQTQCGNVTISYPFGIGPDCSINPWFELTCNTSFNPPKPFYGSREIHDITNSSFRMSNKVASRCYDQSALVMSLRMIRLSQIWVSIHLSPSPN